MTDAAPQSNTFMPEQLDAEWRRLVEEGNNDTIVSLEAKLQKAVTVYEMSLAELRDYARMSLAEPKAIGRSSIVPPNSSADADATNKKKRCGRCQELVSASQLVHHWKYCPGG